jgi:hypothetical protein
MRKITVTVTATARAVRKIYRLYPQLVRFILMIIVVKVITVIRAITVTAAITASKAIKAKIVAVAVIAVATAAMIVRPITVQRGDHGDASHHPIYRHAIHPTLTRHQTKTSIAAIMTSISSH